MDLYGTLQQINQQPHRVRGRQVRRQARACEIRTALRPIVAASPAVTATIKWNQQVQDAFGDNGSPIGSAHPGVAGVQAVRRVLEQFELPQQPEVWYEGMNRQSGRGGYQMRDGELMIGVRMRSMTGADRVISVPVVVREGRVYDPSLFLYSGGKRVMAQSSFDDIFTETTLYAAAPDRAHMYQPPPEARRAPQVAPIVRPGMFGIAPSNRALTASYVRGALRGHYDTGMPTFAQMQRQQRAAQAEDAAARDRAEQEVPDIAAGARVKLSKTLHMVGRSGWRVEVKSGAEGEVIRDIEGDHRFYLVAFDDLFTSARVPADLLRKA